MDFDAKYMCLSGNINKYLESVIPTEHQYIGSILSSMRYSLLAGGKRLRPVLMLSVGEIFGHDADDIMPIACGVEMIHTYSLIHDDLPAMDNDDFRRGRPTNHKVYGEAMAILAGDGLLNFAFEHMLDYACKKKQMKYTKAIYEIVNASGIYGMIGGQVVDVENTGADMDEKTMEYMHCNKTGALISASIKSAAIICDAACSDMKVLEEYSHNLGLAFQVIDDILDVTGDEKKLGKKTGSDINNKKNTFISMYGLDKSREKAHSLTQNALQALEHFGENACFLKQLTMFLLKRDY